MADDPLAEVVELAIATMPTRNRKEAEAVAWLLVKTPVAAHVAEAVRAWAPPTEYAPRHRAD